MRQTVVAIVFALSTFSAQASPGQCLLEVDGKPYLLGRCNVERGNFDKGFQIGGGSPKVASPFFGVVQSDDNVTGDGYWNESAGSTHAHGSLGSMKRSGGCWINERAKICAWP